MSITALLAFVLAAEPPPPLPEVEVDWFRQLRPEIVWYDFTPTMQGSRQMFGGFPGVYDSSRVSFGGGASGNGNREFPWRTTAGMDSAQNGAIAQGFCLPHGRKIKVYVNRSPVVWSFPADTVFVEPLYVLHKGKRIPFSVRTLRKSSDKAGAEWFPAVFGPFRDEAEYLAAGGKPSDKPVNQSLANRHPAQVIRLVSKSDVMPAMSEQDVERMLARPFVDRTGYAWNSNCQEPTAESFSIVPIGYGAGPLVGDTETCMACHRTVGRNVTEFETGREWYGHIRGSDGIFSWHPFDESCISTRPGFAPAPQIRRSLVEAGLVEIIR